MGENDAGGRPSADPAVKRRGEYGAGSVIVWDTGRYDNCTEDSADPERDEPESVKSGKDIEQVADEK